MKLVENLPLDTHLIAGLVTDPADLRLVWPIARYPFDHAQWREALDPGQGHVSFGVHVDGVLAGHAALRRTESRSLFKVSFLYLAPELRSRGLGRQMLGLLEDHAITRLGATGLGLVVRDYNPGAIRCYLQSGFHETSREGTLIRMNKKLVPDPRPAESDPGPGV